MIKADNIPPFFSAAHFVAVVEDAQVETPDEAITRFIRRGIYPFSSYKEARRFKTLVNDATMTETAHLFSRKHEETANDY